MSSVDHTKHLGVYLDGGDYLDSGLNFSKHVCNAVMKATKGVNVLKSTSLSLFKTNLNKFVRPKGNIFFSIRDSLGIKLLTKIRVCFSDLRDHRFNHNFNCANPTTAHFFLFFPRYSTLRTTYLSKISDIRYICATQRPSYSYSHVWQQYLHVTNKSILRKQFISQKSGVLRN